MREQGLGLTIGGIRTGSRFLFFNLFCEPSELLHSSTIFFVPFNKWSYKTLNLTQPSQTKLDCSNGNNNERGGKWRIISTHTHDLVQYHSLIYFLTY